MHPAPAKLPSILDRTTKLTNVLLVYHDADLDGKCAAAIVYNYCDARSIPCKCVGADYDRLPDIAEDAKTRTVVVVDFSFPVETMQAIPDLIWIDHHKTALAAADAAKFAPDGFRALNRAGCELTWYYFQPARAASIPYAVHLLGRWDVWDHQDPNCEPFQMGMRCHQNDPTNGFWMMLFDYGMQPMTDVIESGQTIMQYQEQSRKLTQRNIHTPTWDIAGLDILAINSASHSSKIFEGHFMTAGADLLICYHFTGQKWKVSLYRAPNARADLDCGAIAKTFGGGGHPGAAGFTCAKLPWMN